MSGFWHLPSLPGPRNHIEGINAELRRGRSCVWFLPDQFVTSGWAEELLGELARSHTGVEIPPPEHSNGAVRTEILRAGPVAQVNGIPTWAQDTFSDVDDFDLPTTNVRTMQRPKVTPLAERISHELGLASRLDEDEIGTIVLAPEARERVLIVRGWREPNRDELADVLSRLTAMVKERGRLPHFPRLLIVARDGDIPQSTLRHLDAVTAGIHWWWGAIHRADTSVVVASSLTGGQLHAPRSTQTQLRRMVASEVITEVCGPDLVFASELAMRWDGLMESLHHHITELAVELSLDVTGDVSASNKAPKFVTRPPQELRAAWRSGAVDQWEHETRVSLGARDTAKDTVMLDRLVWRAQNRVLMPLIDESRARLERIFLSRAGKDVLRGLAEQERDRRSPRRSEQQPFEIGTMYHAVRSQKVRLPDKDRECLYLLRDIRNALAHLRPITDRELDEFATVVTPSSS